MAAGRCAEHSLGMRSSGLGQQRQHEKHEDHEHGQAHPEPDHYGVYGRIGVGFIYGYVCNTIKMGT